LVTGGIGVSGNIYVGGILSGALNGTVGATTPAAGSFTTLAASGAITQTTASGTAVIDIIASTAANSALLGLRSNGVTAYLAREGTTPILGGVSGDVLIYNNGLGLKVSTGPTCAVSIPGTLAVTGALSATGTSTLAGVTATKSSGTVATFTQTGATGYGLIIVPGADTVYDAFGINNAANTLNMIRMFGNGTATFAGGVGIGGAASPGSTGLAVTGTLSAAVNRTSGTNTTAITLSDNVSGLQTTGFGTQIQGVSNGGAAVSAIGFEASGGTNNDTAVAFYTQHTAGALTRRVTIDRTGVLDLAVGQIKFPASQNASADANTLDDYEEGTFSTSMNLKFGGANVGMVYGHRKAQYVKIGKMVLVNVYIYLTSKGSSTGQASIEGFPFGTGTDVDFFIPLGVRGNLNTGGNQVSLYSSSAGSTTFTLYQCNLTGGSNAVLSDSAFNNNTELNFNFWYYTEH
jgi:hypothetical protein